MVDAWGERFDNREGGSDGAPKFPMPNTYSFLLKYAHLAKNTDILDHIELTLDKMAFGGIYLIVLDGWGHGDKTKSDAIHNAKTPFIDSLYIKHPNSELLTDGENVGLPKGQMGNSEVGHLNIGAGRVVYQDLVKINIACKDNSIAEMENLKKSFIYAKANNKPLHSSDFDFNDDLLPIGANFWANLARNRLSTQGSSSA